MKLFVVVKTSKYNASRPEVLGVFGTFADAFACKGQDTKDSSGNGDRFPGIVNICEVEAPCVAALFGTNLLHF